MRLVLTLPLATGQGEQTCHIGTFQYWARDADNHFLVDLPWLFNDDLARQLKHLRQLSTTPSKTDDPVTQQAFLS